MLRIANEPLVPPSRAEEFFAGSWPTWAQTLAPLNCSNPFPANILGSQSTSDMETLRQLRFGSGGSAVTVNSR